MIYIECNPDRVLLESLTSVPRREIVHEFKGKYELCIQLGKRHNCTGLIDEDPGGWEPPYAKKAKLQNDPDEHDLKLLYDRSNNNYHPSMPKTGGMGAQGCEGGRRRCKEIRPTQ